MSKNLMMAAQAEIDKGKVLFFSKKYGQAFAFFEKAHVLGQRNIYYHSLSHLWMLRIAFAQRNTKEILGQVIRIPLGVFGSAIGIVPTGNTGGADVGMFAKLPIANDLRQIIDESSHHP